MRLLISIFILLYANISFALDVRTYIPKQAPEHFPTLKEEISKYFSELNSKEYFGGLIEQESCIHLKHSRCWNAKAKLQTSKELGLGLGQLTQAYREDGSIRFDSLSDMVKRHNSELKELSWSNIEYRPDLQIRAIILMTKDNYDRLYEIEDIDQRLKMSDAAYNGGLKGLFKDQRECSLTKDCNFKIWDNHVERTCTKSKKILYDNRNACDINRTHVRNVFDIRMSKYKPFLN